MPVRIRILLIAAFGFGAACTSIAPDVAQEPPAPVVVEPMPEPPPARVAETAARAHPGLEEPLPHIEPPSRILVLRSSDAASYTTVSRSLNQKLTGLYDIEHVNYAELDDAARSRLLAAEPKVAVAIGLDAARFAAAELTVPTIVCQTYELDSLLALRNTVLGVAALPPPPLQLEAWKKLAPDARSVALFVSEGENDFAAAARRAARAAGLEIQIGFVTSDRELLYRFKRRAADLDGLWLAPDNDILSPPVLRELFRYALTHRVHSIVFSPSLLPWGALLSVGGSADDIAATVRDVLDAIVAGRLSELPRVAPLTAVDVHVNEEIATGLGMGNADRPRPRNEVALR